MNLTIPNENVIDQSLDLKEIVKILEKVRYKFLIVTDKSKVVGTLTDGDVRRSILSNYSFENKAVNMMTSDFIYGLEDDSEVLIKKKLKSTGSFFLPVLNKKKELVGVVVDFVIGKESIECDVLIMAGGFGKRLKPLTDSTPKPLLPVGGKPVIERLIERLSITGFNNLYVSLHYKPEMIKNYLGDGSKYGLSIKYLSEEEPLGTIGALSMVPKTKKPVLVVNADILTEVNFSNIYKQHIDSKSIMTVGVRPYTYSIPYGVMRIEDNLIVDIQEKPEDTVFISCGISIISSQLANKINKNNFLELPELIRIAVKKGKVSPYQINEYWADIGNLEDLNLADQLYSSLTES